MTAVTITAETLAAGDVVFDERIDHVSVGPKWITVRAFPAGVTRAADRSLRRFARGSIVTVQRDGATNDDSIYLDRINPAAWTSPELRREVVLALDELVDRTPSPLDIVRAVMPILERYGYDSVDRELSFTLAVAFHAIKYSAIYDAWLHDDTDWAAMARGGA
jgi:limonene-1,2-epoxide hydrolase